MLETDVISVEICISQLDSWVSSWCSYIAILLQPTWDLAIEVVL